MSKEYLREDRTSRPLRPKRRIAGTPPRGRVTRTRTQGGIRLSQHGVVLSEVLRRPGPTHSVADVLAATIHCLARGPRVAVLGFAAGGLVGPLRALGNRAVVEGVDLDPNGYRLFNRMCSPWAGDVRFERADALSWLASREIQADVILDDLSVPSDRDVIKPRISWVEVPGLARNRLSGRGVVVLNWLPPGHESWRAAIRVVAALFPCLRVLFLEDFENRILLGGQKLPPAHDLSRAVRNCLLAIGSRQAGRVAVRTWPC